MSYGIFRIATHFSQYAIYGCGKTGKDTLARSQAESQYLPLLA
jgi:hypothetical protein